MLQKFYIKHHSKDDNSTELYYVICRNFELGKCYDINFNEVEFPKKFLDTILVMIKQSFLMGYDPVDTNKDYDIALGSMIKEPEELQYQPVLGY